MATQVKLFAESLDAWIRLRRSEVLSRASASYPGDDADEAGLREAVRNSPWDAPEFALVPPRLVGGPDGVTLEPFDRAGLPPGVPGPQPDPTPMTRVRILFTGDSAPLGCRPTIGRPAGGWPDAWVGNGVIVVELPSPVHRTQIDDLCRTIGTGVVQIAQDLSLFYQPRSWISEEFTGRWQAARRKRESAGHNRQQVAHLGFELHKR